jgi:hypothetical protein
MKLPLVKSLFFVLLYSCFANAQDASKEEILTIKASLIPSGPYGGMWDISITEFPDLSGAKLKFSRTIGLNSSKFEGSSILGKKTMSEIREALNLQNFFNLPNSISADFVALHMPDYRLEICRSKKCHLVNLYDPGTVTDKEIKTKYEKVWNIVISSLPNWPENWPLISPSSENGNSANVLIGDLVALRKASLNSDYITFDEHTEAGKLGDLSNGYQVYNYRHYFNDNKRVSTRLIILKQTGELVGLYGVNEWAGSIKNDCIFFSYPENEGNSICLIDGMLPKTAWVDGENIEIFQ